MLIHVGHTTQKTMETRKTEKQKALNEEINQGLGDDQIIFDLDMIATYEELDFPVRIKPEESFKIRVKIKTIHDYTN